MKVLLVDDSLEITEMLTEFFSLKGDQVDSVHDGEEAVNKILETRFDVIILDLAMPKTSGFEVLELLKNKNKLEPEKIFVLTAMNITNNEREKIEKYGVHLLLKPISIHDLYASIESK